MAAQTDTRMAYSGTILTLPDTYVAVLIEEFYRLPLREANQIEISIKASYEASLVFYDADKSNTSDYKVEIVIGGSKNTTASIGLKTPNGVNPNVSVQKTGLLSATHYKVFTIRWYYGRVMIYNEGFKKPFLIWNGPKDLKFSNVGVRTVGCSGDWVVQGLPTFKTADSTEYHDTEINCGRFDFEVKGLCDSYVMFTPAPKADRAPSMHIILGGWTGSKRSAIWNNFLEMNFVDEASATLSVNQYRRFWAKWDACNFIVGRGGSEVPFLSWVNVATPFKQMKYFGLQTSVGSISRWHILEKVNQEDVAENPQTAVDTPDVSSTTDGMGQLTISQGGGQGTYEDGGYVIFRPTY